MRSTFIVLCFSILSLQVNASALSCGKGRAVVLDAESSEKPYFTVMITNENKSKSYQFAIVNDFINVSCDSKSDGSLVFVVRRFCGGSACSSHNYGIIDSTTGELIFTPGDRYKGNAEKANTIMGKEIKPTKWRE